MLRDLGWLRQVKLQNASGTVINPATEEKLNEIKTLLEAIDANTDDLEVKAENINLNTDTLEAKVQSVRDQLDVLLSTRASETTLESVLDALGQQTGTNILDEIQDILSKLDVDLSTRASEATLVQVRDYLDTVETKLQSIIDRLDVNLSTRASEATVSNIETLLGGTAKVRLWDGTEEALIDTDGSQIVKDYKDLNRSPLWQRYTLTTTATSVQVVGTYTIPNGWTMALGCVNLAGERTTPVNTNEIIGTVQFQATVNGSTWITLNSQVLRSGITGITTNQCKLTLHPDTLKVPGNGTIAFRMRVAPADTTSTDWQFVLIGYLFQ